MSGKKLPLLLSLFGLWNFTQPRAQDPGSNDGSFDAGSGVSRSGTAAVYAINVQPDGKLLIAGDFTTVNSMARGRVARLHADGSVDPSFDTSTGADDEVLAMALQPDGKVLIAGTFSNVNGTARNRIARLGADGSLDTDFNPGAGADFDVFAVTLMPNGDILLGGAFETVNGVTRSGLVRLDTNGAVNLSFDAALEAGSSVEAFGLQEDKLLIGGYFDSANSSLRRLNSDGSPDETFQSGQGANGEILSILPGSNGTIIVAGGFSTFNGQAAGRIVGLLSDGTLDASFNPGTGANASINAAAQQPDGKILVGGNFDRFNDIPILGLARLMPDGSLDTNFNRGAGIEGSVQAVALQTDGKILVGGFISKVDDVECGGIARLHGDPVLPGVTLSLNQTSTNLVLSWPVTANGFLLQSAESLEEAAWQAEPQAPVEVDGQFTVPVPISSGKRFFRLFRP